MEGIRLVSNFANSHIVIEFAVIYIKEIKNRTMF